MRKLFAVMAAASALLMSGAAQAAQIFTVNAAYGGGGATLTGTFTTNDALTMVTGYNLVSAAKGPFSAITYTTANSSVTAQTLPAQYFQISTPGSTFELRLFFSSALTTAGTTNINSGASYEYQSTGGSRLLSGSVAPQVAAVPEPATWAMMIGGFGLVGGTLRYRRRKTVAAIA